ncbi:MAG: ABC transporter ATP-binding protein [Betaproteobacteria bacterium]|nr:ABC transporter ATP-binding protein [Betaproteobacteria bacterium]
MPSSDPVSAQHAAAAALGPQKESAPVVAFRRLSFGYGERQVIDSVSFEIRSGQVVALMGGSGVGKTTLLRLIAGLIEPQQGVVEVFGKPLDVQHQTQLYEARRRMGLLFQFGALFTDLTCFENVAFPIREHTNLSESMIRDLVLLKLQCVGLRGAAELKPSEISGGMARRVALARAIALDPELILYDEPFAGLDPISLGVTANLIRGLNTALGATSIVVTHDVAETFAIADRIFVFAPSPTGAKLAAQGTPDELRMSEDPFVRQFLDGRMDGPVRFHYPAPPMGQALGLGGS